MDAHKCIDVQNTLALAMHGDCYSHLTNKTKQLLLVEGCVLSLRTVELKHMPILLCLL